MTMSEHHIGIVSQQAKDSGHKVNYDQVKFLDDESELF